MTPNVYHCVPCWGHYEASPGEVVYGVQLAGVLT